MDPAEDLQTSSGPRTAICPRMMFRSVPASCWVAQLAGGSHALSDHCWLVGLMTVASLTTCLRSAEASEPDHAHVSAELKRQREERAQRKQQQRAEYEQKKAPKRAAATHATPSASAQGASSGWAGPEPLSGPTTPPSSNWISELPPAATVLKLFPVRTTSARRPGGTARCACWRS